MPEAAVPLGRPGWVDLASPDVSASKRFYRGLFGWSDFTLAVPSYGDYEILTLGDDQGPVVAGLQSLADDAQPPTWTCYFRVENLQDTAAAVEAAGGQELMPPTNVADLGQVALFQDRQGADFGVALPGILEIGFGTEPSTVCWIELMCPDIRQPRRFYGAVLGWEAVDHVHHGRPWITWKAGDRFFGGAVSPDEPPPHTPAQWIPYFWVTDCDASAARAAELGAHIQLPPTDAPPGRYARLTDPTGAGLGIITPARRPDGAETSTRS
ncbi:VOC family protein [Actinomadura sp. NTSP31]|uniref:VOC family protein n=1 Tax=Actinomadura sp. NTSP31 TaxID=1735447 RepID=UPI0035C26DFF